MTQLIEQNNLQSLSIEELRYRMTQLFNALAAHRQALADCADLTEAIQAARNELRHRSLNM